MLLIIIVTVFVVVVTTLFYLWFLRPGSGAKASPKVELAKAPVQETMEMPKGPEVAKKDTGIEGTKRRIQTLRLAVVAKLPFPDSRKKQIWRYLDDYVGHFIVSTNDGRCRFYSLEGEIIRRKQRISHDQETEFRVLNAVREPITFSRKALLHRTERDPRGKCDVAFGCGDDGHRGKITSICSLGHYFITAGDDSARVYSQQDFNRDPNTYTPKPVYIWKHSHRVEAVNGHGHDAFTACHDGLIRQYSLKDGQLVGTLSSQEEGNSCRCIDANAEVVVSGGSDRKVYVWDRCSGKNRFALKGHKDWVLSLALSPSGDALASCGGTDETVRLWDVRKGHLVWSLSSWQEPVNQVVWGAILIIGLKKKIVLFNGKVSRDEDGTIMCSKEMTRKVTLPSPIIGLSI